MDRLNIEGMKIMSIDDNKNNLLMIEVYAKKLHLEIDSFENPINAVEKLKSCQYDLIIVDYMMREMDGIEFIKQFRVTDLNTPVVMVTAAGNDETLQLRALQVGATDFLTKPLNGAIFQARIYNLLMLKKSILLLEDKAKLLSVEVDKAIMTLKEQEMESLMLLSHLAEYRDPETNAHVTRVAHYSKIIGSACQMNESTQDILFYGSMFHDIGKVGIPDKILLKESELKKECMDTMREHTVIGYELLKDSKSPYLHAGSIISYSHHERYDGTGYPRGLSQERIPLFGRIVAIADVFDALTSRRPYKAPWSFEEAFEYIIKESGLHFDPKCVACFLKEKTRIKEIYLRYQEEIL
ncbi:MAG: response regulator [Clostridia bacterium]|nr:response regulator [Clostridia bacterium]